MRVIRLLAGCALGLASAGAVAQALNQEFSVTLSNSQQTLRFRPLVIEAWRRQSPLGDRTVEAEILTTEVRFSTPTSDEPQDQLAPGPDSPRTSWPQDQLAAGLGLTARVADRVLVFADDDGAFLGGLTRHAVSAGVRVTW